MMFYDLRVTSVCNGEVCYAVDQRALARFPQTSSIPVAVPALPPPPTPKGAPPWWWDPVVRIFWREMNKQGALDPTIPDFADTPGYVPPPRR